MIKLKKLVENPDNIIPRGVRMDFNTYDAFGFLLDEKGKLHVTDWGATHGHLYDMEGDYSYEGRIWTDPKVITFWDYPEPKVFVDIANKLKDKTKIDILSDDWTIEIRRPGEYESEFVPTVEYGDVANKIENPSQQEYQKHLDRAKKDIPKGWGSRKTAAGLSATQLHQIQTTSDGTIKLKKLIESPDTIYDRNGDVRNEYIDEDAYAFYYDFQTNELYISNKSGEDHWHVSHDMKKYPHLADVSQDYIRSKDPDNKFIMGRIWIEGKILSFWQYPNTTKEMKQIADSVSKHFGNINVWNNFNLEIYDDTKGIDWDDSIDDSEGIIIPLKTYKGSDNPPEEEYQQHLLSPMKKKNIKTPKGIGSKKTPAGLSAAQRHQMKMTSDDTIELKSLVESPDNLWIETPGTDDGEYLGYMDDDAYGFYFSNDTLYISDDPGITHGDGIQRSGKYDMNDITRDIYNSGKIPYGRIWVDKELLSFWEPPESRKEMHDISSELSINFGDINVWNNFEVEVYDEDSGDGKLIPVKSYKSSEAAPDEDFQQHLLSPAKKKNKKIPTGIGSTKRPAGLSTAQRHQVQSTSEIKESPDYIRSTKDGKKIIFGHGGRKIPYAFGYYKNKLYIEPNINHSSMPPKGVERERYDYPGRLWTTEKIISFWIYPENKTKLYKIFKDITDSWTSIRMNPKEWYVDVLFDKDSKEIVKRIMTQGGYTDYDVLDSSTAILIPANEYEGSLNNDISVKHMIIPIMKSLYGMKVPKNWGSKRVPAGLSATQLHQMTSTSEGLNEWSDGFMYGDISYEDVEEMDTIAFGYDTFGELVFDYGAVHSQIGVDTGENKNLKRNYAGRVWLEPKVLTFWGYPESKDKLKQIISDLNHDVNGLHINKGWKIEIPKPLLSKKYVKFSRGKKFNFKYEGGAFKAKDEEESVFIPINDYEVSLIANTPGAEKKKKSAMLQHLLSPMVKKSLGIPKDIGSKKTPIGMSVTQRHQMKSTSENKIKESPDEVDLEWDDEIFGAEYGDGDDYGFGYYKRKFYIGHGKVHYDLVAGTGSKLERKDFVYPGRLWSDREIISFWKYPKNRAILYKIFKDIEKDTEIHIDPSKWLVDVFLDVKSKKLIMKIIDDGLGGLDLAKLDDAIAVLIPANEYQGSLDNDINIKHMIAPIIKSIYGIEVPKGLGSKKIPAGLSATQLHQMTSTSENKR